MKACMIAIFSSSLKYMSGTRFEYKEEQKVPFTKIFSDHRLAQAIRIEKEIGNVLWCVTLNKPSLNEELNALVILETGSNAGIFTYALGFRIKFLNTFKECRLLLSRALKTRRVIA